MGYTDELKSLKQKYTAKGHFEDEKLKQKLADINATDLAGATLDKVGNNIVDAGISIFDSISTGLATARLAIEVKAAEIKADNKLKKQIREEVESRYENVKNASSTVPVSHAVSEDSA